MNLIDNMDLIDIMDLIYIMNLIDRSRKGEKRREK